MADTFPPSPWSGRHTAKDTLRQRIWTTLQQQAAVRRDPTGHIPNFIGADKAADRLAQTNLWQQAQVIKCNPDSPHAPVRQRAIAEGKCLYMAVPKLTRPDCFVEVTLESLQAQAATPTQGATMKGALTYGRPVAFDAMGPIDLVIVGCVAAATGGGRTGKGAGFADLELAMLRQRGLIADDTPIVTTVHDLQLVDNAELPMEPHDWALDLIVTPTRTLATHSRHPKPAGIDWSSLRPDQIASIPVLQTWPRSHTD